MSHIPQYGIISCQKNIHTCPWYANIIRHEDMLFNLNPGTRYPVTLGIPHLKMYSNMKPEKKDQIIFDNFDVYGGCKRVFINADIIGDGGELVSHDFIEQRRDDGFICIYYPIVKEIYWVGLNGGEARFGGIVISPMYDRAIVKYRVQFLMQRWRAIAPLVGKWAIVLKKLYNEITYRPDNQGAKITALHYQAIVNSNTKNQIES